jgi:hypothetical protein
MRLLVLAPRAVGAADVRAALPNDDLTGAQVLVVTPAHVESAVAFCLSDADQVDTSAHQAAQTLAESPQRAALATDDDPLLALHDAMRVYTADRIVVYDDGLAAEARERFDVPVTHGHLRT